VFWLPPKRTEWIAGQLFKESDWNVVSKFMSQASPRLPKIHSCANCSAIALGTRFATFSYRKALDFPMHERSWDSAERLLQGANTWIFIGYSLPPADYEFKLLLKRVQLSRYKAPDIVLVTGGGPAADHTELSYKKFFGPHITEVFKDGLDDGAKDHLRGIGALRSS
jgi:hypothetical protein